MDNFFKPKVAFTACAVALSATLFSFSSVKTTEKSLGNVRAIKVSNVTLVKTGEAPQFTGALARYAAYVYRTSSRAVIDELAMVTQTTPAVSEKKQSNQAVEEVKADKIKKLD